MFPVHGAIVFEIYFDWKSGTGFLLFKYKLLRPNRFSPKIINFKAVDINTTNN